MDFVASKEGLCIRIQFYRLVMRKQIIRCIRMDILDRQEVVIMDSCKVYVNVTAEFTKDGRLLPKSFVWKDDHVYEIQRVTDIRRAASLRAISKITSFFGCRAAI